MDGSGLTGPVVPPGLATKISARSRAPEGRGLTPDLLVPGRPHSHVSLDRVVQAGDGFADGGGVDDLGHSLARYLPDECAVALIDRLVQGGGEATPALFVTVQAVHDRHSDLGPGHWTVRVGARQGRPIDGGEQVPDLLHSGVGAAGERAPLSRLAPVDVGSQRALQALHRSCLPLIQGDAGIEGAVEDHVAGVGREELGVVSPQVGAVGDPQVVESLVS